MYLLTADWRKLIPELEKMGITSSPHAFGELLKPRHYCTHLTERLGNTVPSAGVPATSEDIDFGKYKVESGKFLSSPAPGFGMTLLKRSDSCDRNSG